MAANLVFNVAALELIRQAGNVAMRWAPWVRRGLASAFPSARRAHSDSTQARGAERRWLKLLLLPAPLACSLTMSSIVPLTIYAFTVSRPAPAARPRARQLHALPPPAACYTAPHL